MCKYAFCLSGDILLLHFEWPHNGNLLLYNFLNIMCFAHDMVFPKIPYNKANLACLGSGHCSTKCIETIALGIYFNLGASAILFVHRYQQYMHIGICFYDIYNVEMCLVLNVI